MYGVFGGSRLIDEFRQRSRPTVAAIAVPPQPRAVARDAEPERLILAGDLGYEKPETG
ncbi:MAG TPA: hypothetical protein VFY56_16325 [Propionibacteriaceae bacterium]|nr:hypothetical protein [Propionibacteriaceae bacterium]